MLSRYLTTMTQKGNVTMANGNNIIAAVLAASLATPSLAVPPETITSYCAERARVVAGSVDTNAHYRAGFVDGFLDAVMDSLRKDGWVCPPVDAQKFCDLFSRSDFLGGGAFGRARDALLHVCKLAG